MVMIFGGGAIASPSINGVVMDGTNDWLELNSTNIYTDSTKVTFSFWIDHDDTASNYVFELGSSTSSRFNIVIGPSVARDVAVDGRNAAGTIILRVNSGTNYLSASGWHHVLGSFDLTDTGKRHLYLDGVDVLNVVTYTNDTLDFDSGSNTETRVGADLSEAAANMWDGKMAEFWFDTDRYVDFSSSANREKFAVSNTAIYLGGDGSVPFGAAPDIFLSGETSAWQTNKGAGSGFTLNGSLSTAGTLPPSY